MEKSETPLIDLAPELFMTIKKCQDVLAEWRLRDSKTTNSEVLNELIIILCDKGLVKRMKEAVNIPEMTEENKLLERYRID